MQTLGEGGFGSGFKCCYNQDGCEYAIEKSMIQSSLDQIGQLSA